MSKAEHGFRFDNTFARSLEGFYVPIQGQQAPAPKVLLSNDELVKQLGLEPEFLRSQEAADILSGKTKPEGSFPISQAYAGHQFGGFSPSLGDGRAMLLGEVLDSKGNRKDIQLKGSGITPFSRNGDGKATLGPVLREYLVSEAMHALGIPTTRALAAVTTGERVYRETALPGAVLTRVAASHIRVGTFQFFAARGQEDKVKQLADYAIERHFPNLMDAKEKYLEFLRTVIQRQSSLVAKWMSVGFVHGVMNTDNMTISGETIDYGPCAFMDVYKANTVFSSIDEMGRYAYRMQPVILQWNLARLAECLLSLIDQDDKDNAVRIATEEINQIPQTYEILWLTEMRKKAGLNEPRNHDKSLIEELLEVMEAEEADFTLTFRYLSSVIEGDENMFLSRFKRLEQAKSWLEKWQERLSEEATSSEEKLELMHSTNPVYIPRNHLVEEALGKGVTRDNLEPFHKLLAAVKSPFTKQKDYERFENGPDDDFGPYVTYCGT